MAYTPTEFAMLKTDLGFLTDPPEAVTDYMQKLLEKARIDLERDGVTIDQNNTADEELVAMYAAWLYRRRDTGGGKPQMLRDALNDRKVHEAVGAS